MVIDIEVDIFVCFTQVADLTEEFLAIFVVFAEFSRQYKFNRRIVRDSVNQNKLLSIIESGTQLLFCQVVVMIITEERKLN